MGDHLWADKLPQYFTKPSRPTQPPTLIGTGNKYQPKWSDVLWPGSKGRLIPLRMNVWDWWQVRLCNPLLTRALPERRRDDRLIISAIEIRLLLVVWLWVFATEVYGICR